MLLLLEGGHIVVVGGGRTSCCYCCCCWREDLVELPGLQQRDTSQYLPINFQQVFLNYVREGAYAHTTLPPYLDLAIDEAGKRLTSLIQDMTFRKSALSVVPPALVQKTCPAVLHHPLISPRCWQNGHSEKASTSWSTSFPSKKHEGQGSGVIS